MTLEAFKGLLTEAMAQEGIRVSHILAAADVSCPVLCWQEIGIHHLRGDDEVVAHIVRGQLDLFTETEYDLRHQAVTDFLTSMDCLFVYEGTSYDSERGEWRYIWTFWLFGG